MSTSAIKNGTKPTSIEKRATDLNIPVAYGRISCKVWAAGDDTTETKDIERIIALHGWQDNCGSFDELIPLLTKRAVIVAVDFPGHGWSSHLPEGIPYSDLSYAIDVRRIADHLNWTEETGGFTLMGHSMGGYVSIYFASVFPKLVKRVISLDIGKPLTFKPEELADSAGEAIEKFLDSERRIKKIVKEFDYSYEEAIERLIDGHKKLGELNRTGAVALLRRGARKIDPSDPASRVMFTRDMRLRALIFQRMDKSCVRAYVQNLRCELLLVQAVGGIKLDPDEVTKEFMELYGQVSRRFVHATCEGHHHVHLDEADKVAPIINEFLEGAASDHVQNGSNGVNHK